MVRRGTLVAPPAKGEIEGGFEGCVGLKHLVRAAGRPETGEHHPAPGCTSGTG